MYILINIVRLVIQALTLIIFADILLSYFVSPWHPIRQFLDRIVEPLLAPIRRVVPRVGMFDFSPLILLILIQVLGNFLIRMLLAL